MPVKSLEALFVEELKDIYDAEKRLTKALPKIAKACETDDLRDAIEAHLTETQGQVERLEKVFEIIEKTASRKTCQAMKGLLEEGEEIMNEDFDDGALKDAGIVSACQKVEHYEIASYGTLCEWARVLGLEEVATLLNQTLEEEKAADKKLTEVGTQLNIQSPFGEAA